MMTIGSERAGRIGTGLLVTLVTLSGAGCGDLLDVELPGSVPSSTLDDPALANVLVLSAISDFECAFVNYVAATGLLTDELYISTELIAPSVWDQRRIAPDNGNLSTSGCTSTGFGMFRPLQTARFMAEQAFNKIDGYTDAQVPNRTLLQATASAYAGYAYTLLGEGFCEMTVDVGPLLTPRQVLETAEQRFTRAMELATTANNAEILNMAKVGRARVRLNLGKGAEAATDARQVPVAYVKNATYSAVNARRENQVYTYNGRQLYVSVDPRYRNLTIGGVADSRVPMRDAGRRGHDGITPLWLQLKYQAEAAPIALATGREAQLIIAEVEGGQSAVGIINTLRVRVSLPAFSSTDAAAIRAQVREERRRELFLEGHRLNDMLRFDLPFDVGVNHKGVPFGDTECLPLPSVERDQNPNIPR